MFGPSEGIGTFSNSAVGGNGGVVVGRRVKAGGGRVAATVDHVFVRAKEKLKTVSGGEGRGRLGPKEKVDDTGEKGTGRRTRAQGGKAGVPSGVWGALALDREGPSCPQDQARGRKKKGRAEGQLIFLV